MAKSPGPPRARAKPYNQLIRDFTKEWATLRTVIIARALAAAAIAVGLAAWVVFLRMGLVLAHYDAKAHLVVARRIFDNITPGWQQIGAIWLPLPHLIHALPTQLDLFYRTGAFASLVSVACLGVTTYAGARLVLLMTGSRLAACVAAALEARYRALAGAPA